MANDGQDATIPRWPLAFALVVVAAVIASLFLLLPDEATVTAPNPAESPSASTSSTTTDASQPASTTTTTEPRSIAPGTAVARQIDVDFAPRQLIEWNGRLFAIADNDPGEPIQLFESTDGIEWTRVDLDVSLPPADRMAIDESGFIRGNDQLALVGVNGQTESLVFVRTQDGSTWEKLDADWVPKLRSAPSFVRDDGIVVTESLGHPVRSVLQEHTNLEPPESGICAIFDGTDEVPIYPCDGEIQLSLSAENVSSGVASSQLLECASSIGDQQLFGATTLRFIGPTANPASEQSPTFETGIIFIEPLPDERIAVVTKRLERIAACDGIVDLPEPTNSSLVILDETLGVESEHLLAQEINGRFARVVGEIDRPSRTGSRIIVQTPSDFWALDTATGEWEMIFDMQTGGGSAGPAVLSGEVLYHNQSRGLGVLEVANDAADNNGNNERILEYITESGDAGPVSTGSGVFRNIPITPTQLSVLDRAGRLWIVDVAPAS